MEALMKRIAVALGTASLLFGCALDEQVSSDESALEGAAVVNDWSVRTTQTGAAVGQNALRTLLTTTMVHLAMYDAVNAIDGGHVGYASKPAAAAGASKEAAAIRAAYVVLLAEYPTRATQLTASYDAALASLSASEQAKADGIAVGTEAANAVLAARQGDHRDDPDSYTVGSGPGVWQPTAPAFLAASLPHLKDVRPFSFDDISQYRPAGPPDLSTKKWAELFNEVKVYGKSDSTVRTAEQTATATFWSGSSSAIWQPVIRNRGASMNIVDAARFEAMGFVGMVDGLLATWDAKYAYNFWRPITAIRAADTDGNDDTAPDPTWSSLHVTPNHPEYVSAHATVSSTAIYAMAGFFDTKDFTITVVSPTNGQVRVFQNVAPPLAEIEDARVWSGIHYRDSDETGTKIGQKIGVHIKHRFRAID
jgi:hypothetical protein